MQESRSGHSILVFLGLIVAGLVGNYFSFPLFLNIDFLFGSIFAMLALQLYGQWRGVLAAALIASYTYILWNHPYAIIVATAEVAVVGWLMSCRKLSAVWADVLFWLLLGMPLLYVFYHTILGVPHNGVHIVLVKQAVNGVANVLMARILFFAWQRGSRKDNLSLRELFSNLLTAFLLFPALIMLAVSGHSDFEDLDHEIRSSLKQKSLTLTDRLSDWVDGRRREVVELTKIAENLSPQQMQARLEQALALNDDFLRIGMRDTESAIVAYAPPVDTTGLSNIGKKFPERPYISELKTTLKPMLGEVVMGRIDQPEPVVNLLAPVLRQGVYGGYINGVLKLERIRQSLATFSEGDTLFYSLLDVKGKVILSNRPDQKMMAVFDRGSGSFERVDGGIKQWVPKMARNTSALERWTNSYYLAETTVSDLGAWQLLLEQPIAPYQKTLYESYTRNLTLLFAILILTLALAEVLSRRAMRSLQQLSELTRGMPRKLASGESQPALPRSNIVEIDQLVENFGSMSDLVVQQFNEIKQANDTLEQRVRERTAELSESESRFHYFFESNSSVMVLIDPNTKRIEDVNQAAVDYYGLSHEELTGKLISDINVFSLERITLEHELARQKKQKFYPAQHRLASGELRDVEIYLTEISIAGHDSVFAMVHDVTERERARKALAESEAKHRALIENSHDIIYTLDANGVFTFVSPSWTHLLGHQLSEVVGSPFEKFVHPEDLLTCKSAFHALFVTGHRQTDIEYRVRRHDGSWRWHNSNALPLMDESGQIVGFQGNAKDISERIEIEEKMRQLALYDALTKLPNRRLLTERLNQVLAVCKRNRSFGALMFLDLDNFKSLNDTHGHSMGDLLLIEVARRLTECVRGTDTVSRFGGDEFVLMLGELDSDSSVAWSKAAGVAEKIRLSLSQPYCLTSAEDQLRVVEHHCTASIGVVVFGADGASQEDILKWADEAMYMAKDAGRNRVQIRGV